MKQQNRAKQQLFIGATVQPIQNCQLLVSTEDSSLFIHKRSLIIMNLALQTMKSCLIEDEKILSAAYYASLEVFIINTDKYLLIINKEAEVISRQRITELLEAKSLLILNMEDGYQGVPYQRHDQLLFFTNQYMFQAEILIKFERSLLKTKSLCAINLSFIEKPSIAHFQWTSQYVFLQKIRLLICWNQTETYVFEVPRRLQQKVSRLYVFDKILRKNKLYQSDNKINAFEASMKNRLLIAAFQLGSIKVYKLDETKKYLCQMRGHQRECTGLHIPQSNPNLLYSCGLDNSVRIWDLMDFGQIYHVRFDVMCSRVEMLNEKLVFAKSLDNRRAFFIKFNIGLLKPVLSQSKSDRILSLTTDGEWGISLYSNNFVQAFLLGDYNNEARQFNEKIEFPNKYGFLRAAVKLKQETFAVCLEKGFSIMKLNKKQSQNENFELKRLVYNHSLQPKSDQKGKLIEIIHQKLLGTYFFSIIEDWKNIPIAIHVTAVSFLLNTIVPKCDIDVCSKSPDKEEDYVVLGTDRGYIYFINIKLRTHYHTRVNFHSDWVTCIQRIKIRNSQSLNFISITLSQQISIWELSENRAPTLHTRLTYTKDISILKPIEEFLAIGCKSGQFVIFQMQENQSQKVQFMESLLFKEEGHLKSIIAIDATDSKGQKIWLTGGEDYSIKLWRGIQKELVFEIRIFSMINCVIFAKRDLDLILSHGENGQISIITEKNIPQFSELKEKLDNKTNLKDLLFNEIDLRAFLCPTTQETSPSSPRKKQKEHTGVIKDGSPRTDLDELLKHRSKQKQLELPLYLGLDKKQATRRESKKQKSPNKDQDLSIKLPKINSKQIYLGSQSSRYKGQKSVEYSVLENVSTSRLKSYSQAGKMNH